jgi:1,4-alpha-glucan branching enzyme
LVVNAPLKHKFVVVGDFNNWTQQSAYQMNETPDSNFFWLQINGLTPGTEYAYQYVIDDTLQLADYNTEKVLDASVDPFHPGFHLS